MMIRIIGRKDFSVWIDIISFVVHKSESVACQAFCLNRFWQHSGNTFV